MSTPTVEGLRAAWVEQQARERARRGAPDGITDRDADGAAFDDWLRRDRRDVWEAALVETEKQGAIQVPDNPYEEGWTWHG